ncbi:hypothetical protein TURU_120505 [Turdus rufiventris]|nr:hypothetical protein TURU_120505 [Turdus rufiventris]
MSAPPEPQELLLAGWAADGPEQYGTDGDVDQQREQLGLGSGREHPPVTMATASPVNQHREELARNSPVCAALLIPTRLVQGLGFENQPEIVERFRNIFKLAVGPALSQAGFVSKPDYQSMSWVHMWVSPVADKEETSLARALYPKTSPGYNPSPHQSPLDISKPQMQKLQI